MSPAAEKPVTDEVVLYTDGACSGNPGPGGWAYILRHPGSGAVKRGSGAESGTTNNRMEMLAVIKGLAVLKRACRVVVVTDSKYVSEGLATWLEGWKKRGWRRADKGAVKNEDLWRELDRLAGLHTIRTQLIPGHAGHPENEECDRMAVAAYQALKGR